MPALTDYDKRCFDAAEKPGGITTVGNLFCKGQISVSAEYCENFDQIKWKKDGCMEGTCFLFDTQDCLENYEAEVAKDPKKCPLYGQ